MPNKFPSVLLGALVSIVLSLLIQFLSANSPGNPVMGILACLLIFVGPLVAVWHYTNTHNLTLKAGQGAGIGALTGVIAGIIGGIIGYALLAAGVFPDPMEAARVQLEQQGMSEEEIEQAMSIAQTFSNPAVTVVLGVVMGAIVGAIGGVIGAALFKKGGTGEAY
ncbi:MAG TPA: DUF4199 family protein [Rubricoccaceae bacterium]|nr:DUF4199 family protein [Rubricoccaceae bacterium]